MIIALNPDILIQENLTESQAREAVTLANASKAGAYLHFYAFLSNLKDRETYRVWARVKAITEETKNHGYNGFSIVIPDSPDT